MKKISVLAILLLATFFVKAQGIKFEDQLSWEDVKAKAKAENKSIFLDFYGTFCAPCKWMDQNVYNQQSVGDYMNKNFISVRIQQDKTTTDSKFIKSWYKTSELLIKQYAISLYPTIVFTNAEGIAVFRMDGTTYSPESFIKGAKMSLDPDVSFIERLKAFREGKREANSVLELIRYAKTLGLEEQANQIGSEYISQLKNSQLSIEDNVWILFETTSSTQDPGFQFFLNSGKQIARANPDLTISWVNTVVDDIIYKSLVTPSLQSINGKPDWMTIKDKLRQWGKRGEDILLRAEIVDAGKFGDSIYRVKISPLVAKNISWEELLDSVHSLQAGKAEERIVGTTIISYMNRMMKGEENTFDKFVKAVSYYEKNYPTMINVLGLNNWAWFSFLKTDNKTYLEKAIEWSKKSVELGGGSSMYLDTYANLLYKAGRKSEGLKFEEKACAKDPNIGEFKDTLEKMKKGEPTWNRAF